MQIFEYGNRRNDLAAIVALLLEHLNGLDLHLAIFRPGRVPLIASVPELVRCDRVAVYPRLARNTILEPAVGTPDSNVQDEIEVLIKRGCRSARSPRVDDCSAVGVSCWEVTLLPEWLVEVDVHDLEKTSVNVSEDILWAPFETIRVETRSVSRVKRLVLAVCAPPTVIIWVWTPVKCRRDDVVATGWVRVVVATRFHDVYLAGLWPRAVDIVYGQHPDGWPHPVARGKLSFDFDTAVLDRLAFDGADASRLHWVDNGAVRGVSYSNAV